jgi:hypothetical protein
VFTLSLPGFELYDHLLSKATTLQNFIDKRAAMIAGTVGPCWLIVDDIITFHGRIFLPQSSGAWAAVL